jgi:uncharacterized membrane protein YfcA
MSLTAKPAADTADNGQASPSGSWYERHRRTIYPAAVLLIYSVWVSYMTLADKWSLFQDHWPASLTMVLGSFVAGATAEGGGAVAYPVFTKVLHLATEDARTFALMIQTFGMGMAALFIITRRIRFLPMVVLWVSLGGFIGHAMGLFHLTMPPNYPKILFTFVTTCFGVVLFISTYVIRWKPIPGFRTFGAARRAVFLLVGIAGGTFASQVGSGIDVLSFMVITLAFGIEEKVAVPTTVIIMAINSAFGFFLHGVVLDDIGPMWNHWLVAVQIVILGAPLGAWVTSRVPRTYIINFLLALIGLELMTTLLLVPIQTREQILFTVSAVTFFGALFAVMLWYRHRHLPDRFG